MLYKSLFQLYPDNFQNNYFLLSDKLEDIRYIPLRLISSLTMFTSSIQTTMAKSESKAVQRNKRSRTPPQTISPWPRTLLLCSVALAVVAALALLWLPARVNDGRLSQLFPRFLVLSSSWPFLNSYF